DPLPPPPHGRDAAANESRHPGLGPAIPQRAPAGTDRGDALADQHRPQIAHHRLDFRQLRHKRSKREKVEGLYRAFGMLEYRTAAELINSVEIRTGAGSASRSSRTRGCRRWRT